MYVHMPCVVKKRIKFVRNTVLLLNVFGGLKFFVLSSFFPPFFFWWCLFYSIFFIQYEDVMVFDNFTMTKLRWNYQEPGLGGFKPLVLNRFSTLWFPFIINTLILIMFLKTCKFENEILLVLPLADSAQYLRYFAIHVNGQIW